MTKDEQLSKNRSKNPNEHLLPKKVNWIHTMPCFVCGAIGGSEAHHTIIKGMGGRNKQNDLYIIPLCPIHHRGEFSPHGRDANLFYREYPKQYIKKRAEEYQVRWEDNNGNSD